MFLASYKCFLFKIFKSSLFLLIYIAVGSCGTVPNDEGEIVGHVASSESKKNVPLGMVFIPAGTFLMGGGVNQGVVGKTNITQTTTVGPFYMDKTEVTVSQYFEFIDIVRADPAAYGLDEAYIDAKLMPDPTVWQRDFDFMFKDDSFGKTYCSDPRFNDRPIVGVTFEAAQQFARVRTIYRNKYLETKGLPPGPPFRLPTAAEYEYAAKGGRSSGQYPWGGPFVRDSKGNLLANFQLTKGNYAASGYTYTSPVKAFPPNDYGLYDMSGNVSEWCEDVYTPFPIYNSKRISSFYKDEKGLFRVIKSGSWKDYSYMLQTGVSDCEHKDMARAYIGFRCVMSAI